MTNWLLVTVCLGPFLFGLVEPWSIGLVCASIFLLAIAVAVRKSFSWSEVPAHAWGILLVAGLAYLQSRHPGHANDLPGGPATASSFATGDTVRLWVAYALLAWLAAALLRGRRPAFRIVTALFWIGTVVAVAGIIQKGSGSGMFWGFVREIPRGFSAFGPYYYKNHAGGLLAMTFCLGVGMIVARSAGYRGARTPGALAEFWAEQSLLICALGAQGVGIWMSGSRGAFHSLVGGAVALGLLGTFGIAPRMERGRWIAALFVGVSAYVALVVSFPVLADYSERGLEGSMAGRFRIWDISMAMFDARPVFGHGLGAYVYTYPFYAPATGAMPGVVEHAHAEWLELLCTGGLVGVALYGIGLIVQLWASTRWWWAWGEPETRRVLGGALAATFVFIVHGLADLNLASPANALVFLAVSVLAFPPRSRGTGPGALAIPVRAGHAGRALVVALAAWGLVGSVRQLGGWVYAYRAVDAEPASRVPLYSRGLAFMPGHPGYARELATAYLWLGELHPAARRIFAGKALRVSTAGLRSTPDHPGLLETAGIAIWWRGDPETGKRYLAAANALRPWRRPPPPVRRPVL